MRNVISLVLGGGKGTRLYPLTKYRSKPAVPLAGKYRLIDIPISNCLNSHFNRIYVLTQFNSVSLHRHIRNTYTFDQFGGGFVEILAAQQTTEKIGWYQGTADAVRQNLRYVLEYGVEYVIILSGDQLYRMDYADMLKTHIDSGAQVTIGALPVDRAAARGFGILRADDSGRVIGFLEKPKTDAEIDMVTTPPEWIDAHGIESRGRDCLASMGIYVFNRDTLVECLTKTDYSDFGKEVFPASIRTRKVQMHLFDGYWEDIGTIGAFYEANLALTTSKPPFDFAHPKFPVYTHARFLPPTVMDGATIKGSLIADGCRIGSGTVIENSVIGLRCSIGQNVVIRNSILMGADYFQTAEEVATDRANGRPLIGIGDGTVIEGAIVDKNCHIGAGVRIANDNNIEFSDETEHAVIADRIMVIPSNITLPDGWKYS